MFHEYQVDDTEAIDEFLDLIVDEDDSELSKNGFSLAENVVGMWNGLLDLIEGMFFLNVMESIFQVRKLQLHVLG